MTYAQKIKALLSPAERRVFERLKTPEKIQNLLDSFPINFELAGEEGAFGPRVVLRKRKAQCMEGALFAATALAYHGHPPLLMDLKTPPYEDDHVVALFKRGGCWGAISKTNHPVLRWRDPLFKTPRDVALSYFHEYFLSRTGEKTLRSYSRPFNLRFYSPARFVTSEQDMGWLIDKLDASPHLPIAPRKTLGQARRVSVLERRASESTEWKVPRRR